MGEVIETIDTAHPGTGLQYELAEVERCLAAGLMESPIRPVSTTLEIMDWMDDIRAEAGISWGR